MKVLISFLILIGAMTVHAKSVNATIDDLFCGEMDPYIVGDICLLTLTQENNKKLAIMMDIDDFYDQFDEYDLEEGLEVIFDNRTLSRIYDDDTLDVLKDYDADYFYMNAETLNLVVLDEAEVSSRKMKEFIKKINGNFTTLRVPEGYTAKKIKKPRLTKNLVIYLNAATHVKRSQWSQLVLNSDEYGHLSRQQRIEVAKNPHKELGVKYLLEIDDIFEIYKGNQFIGYYIEVSDHVQAAIYQDGAWIEMFLDIDMNVLKATDESA